ncbi:MAG TPA: DUF815 domain-containing protein [Spirochaetota bacterium]|nr:DUF815 domain-containing protein [Spirochaetota bacterium]
MLLILTSENPLSAAAANGQEINPLVLALAKRELDVLETLARLGSKRFFQIHALANHVQELDFNGLVTLNADSKHKTIPGFEEMAELFTQPLPWSQRIDDLVRWYRRHGSGASVYQFAFELSNSYGIPKDELKPIPDIDLPTSDEFFCYEEQRQIVRQNTARFIAGRPAQDLLLHGDRGTGKSSTVRLMLHEFADQGLRLIRAETKTDTLRNLFQNVKDQRWKYLIFIDDISFDILGSTALEFRSLIQGDLMERPKNVLFYVTSNRRNIIKIKASEKDDSDPLNLAEDEQEMLALSDRFGIKVWFPTPTQEEYLSIARGLAAKKNITLSADEIDRRALLWAEARNGRSPRTAEQFVRSLEAETAEV